MTTLSNEARQHRTVILTAREKDGSVEVREVEPYSLRRGKEVNRLMYYCLAKQGLRSVLVPNIISVKPTGRAFEPRWTVEF